MRKLSGSTDARLDPALSLPLGSVTPHATFSPETRWLAHDGVPTIESTSLIPELAEYRASRSYSAQSYAGSPGLVAFAGFELATAHRLPPQYRFTRRTCVRSDWSVSNAVDGSPYSVKASPLIPPGKWRDVVLVCFF